MLSTLPGSELSADFRCPHCGVSAFEVVSEPPEDDTYESSPSLFMRCFGCHHVFQHPLEEVLIAMADSVG